MAYAQLTFAGCSQADLVSREIAASLDGGVRTHNRITDPAHGLVGMFTTSIGGPPWHDTILFRDASVLLRFVLGELERRPFIAGSGEFGGGSGIDGLYYNVVQNALVALMLDTIGMRLHAADRAVCAVPGRVPSADGPLDAAFRGCGRDMVLAPRDGNRMAPAYAVMAEQPRRVARRDRGLPRRRRRDVVVRQSAVGASRDGVVQTGVAGDARNSVGWEYGTLLGLASQCEPRMVQVNRRTRSSVASSWSNSSKSWSSAWPGRRSTNWMTGVTWTTTRPCPSRDRAVMQAVRETLCDFFAAACARSPRFCLASETHWDRAISFVDASYSRFFSREHLPTVGYTFPEFWQSCCITGHYDYAMINNCLRYGHLVTVEARCLHGSAADAPKLAAYVKEALRLRRDLWETLWHSRVVGPTGVEVTGDGDVLHGLHRSRMTG